MQNKKGSFQALLIRLSTGCPPERSRRTIRVPSMQEETTFQALETEFHVARGWAPADHKMHGYRVTRCMAIVGGNATLRGVAGKAGEESANRGPVAAVG